MAIDYFAQQFGEDRFEDSGIPSYVMDRLNVGAPPTTTFGPVAPATAPVVSNTDINAYVQANIGNPQAIADAAQQYGVSAEQLSQATGYDANTVSNYFSNAGINFGQPAPLAPVAAPVDYFAQQFQPDAYSQPTYTQTNEQGTPIYEPAYQPPLPPQAPIYQTPPPQPIFDRLIGIEPPESATYDPNAVQRRIIEEERKRNLEGGLASLGAGLPGQSSSANKLSPKPVPLGDGTFRTSGGTIIDSEGRPVTPSSLPVAPKETQYGTVTPYTTTQIKDYVSGVMGDASLTPFERTNKIMEAAQKAGISQGDLTAMYGKNVVDPYIKDYGAGMKSFITDTLGDKTRSDFDKVAAINQAANKYGLDANEIAEYSGLNKKGVDQMFTAFDTGLAGIVKNLSAPTVSDLDKTKGVLALQQKYSITDDQIAKALGGNVTGKDVTAYLAPVKNFGSDLQTLTSDQTKTAYDIQAFLDNAKKDPRIEGLYGLAIDKVQKAVPILGLRDSIAGNGSPEQLTKGYTDFVAAVNADPALREKYGAQADAIDQVAKLSQRIADEKYGGKLQPHMFQTFIGLDQKTMKDVPKQLEMTESTTQTITDNEGQQQTYTTPGQVKDTKGLEPVYTYTGSGEDETRELTGYTKPMKTSAGVTVDAQYDAQGKLTGYRGRHEDKVWPKHRVGISGQWDADGKASPVTRVESPGVLKGMIQDVAALGPVGQLAIAFATSGLGSLAAGALTPTLGATAAKVVTSGIINGAMAEMGGGKFGKGFLTGAAGAGTNMLAQNFMPTIDTGNAFADQYFNKALPNLATSTIGAAINKQDIGQAGISSLLNTGTNMATSSLINSAMPDTLTPEMQKMFTGVSGQLLSSLLQDKPIDLQKSIISTIMQNAMSPSKTTAKEKG
jgi:UDP-glucose 6-dehydrogenase